MLALRPIPDRFPLSCAPPDLSVTNADCVSQSSIPDCLAHRSPRRLVPLHPESIPRQPFVSAQAIPSARPERIIDGRFIVPDLRGMTLIIPGLTENANS